MDRQRILEAAQKFEELPKDYSRFDMNQYLGSGMRVDTLSSGIRVIVDVNPDSSCGTVGCIAGHIAFWNQLSVNHGVDLAAGRYLEVDEEVSRMLFCPSSLPYGGMTEITAQESAQALRNLAVYDDPRWEEIVSCRQATS